MNDEAHVYNWTRNGFTNDSEPLGRVKSTVE